MIRTKVQAVCCPPSLTAKQRACFTEQSYLLILPCHKVLVVCLSGTILHTFLIIA